MNRENKMRLSVTLAAAALLLAVAQSAHAQAAPLIPPTKPVAGQGLNLGLRDAQVLVDALREWTEAAAQTGQTLDAALAGVERQRAPDRWPMIAATDFLARSFAWRLPGLPGLRGLALAGLELATPLKAALARRMMFGN